MCKCRERVKQISNFPLTSHCARCHTMFPLVESRFS